MSHIIFSPFLKLLCIAEKIVRFSGIDTCSVMGYWVVYVDVVVRNAQPGVKLE